MLKKVVVVIRYQSKIRWFLSDRDFWVLDLNKWREEFINYGYDVPDFSNSYRFGIHTVNQDTVEQFLDFMSEFEVSKDKLSIKLAKRYPSASSWWDVKDLFPIMFVNLAGSIPALISYKYWYCSYDNSRRCCKY